MALGKLLKWVKGSIQNIKDKFTRGKKFLKNNAPDIINNLEKGINVASSIAGQYLDPNSKAGQIVNNGLNFAQNANRRAGQILQQTNNVLNQIPNVG